MANYIIIIIVVYYITHLNKQHAIGRKFRSKGEKHDHWLDFASDRFDNQLIGDVKQVLRVLVLYLPIPIFWALYDQQVWKQYFN